ncbi:5-oxoprolinase subunit C family protein [Undibacterium flavidum]|uniref:Biotin-dependent carboxyltransferase family protein n=1 Tax=Undibacterium flavidum TaxID=2762297 RepID=A0ABR6Y755_9BURK|nr:biotin-dependent carboxyltransferase family protein [Undibacterium flavidum]MBC3872423.1 biotin-dependent carboxyltransferase family protein [Undibacterium flavidum]
MHNLIDITSDLRAGILIQKAGIQTTVQDLGRRGLRHLGISQAGALDATSLILANKLVGNPEHYAGLEIVIGPLQIVFQRATWFALCGANFAAELDGKLVAKAWRHFAQAGQTLCLQGAQKEARAYLAVDGGIEVESILGSRATDLQAGFGGHQGRALRKGDVLTLGQPRLFKRSVGVLQRCWTPEIRAIRGPEFAQFNSCARKKFWQQAWRVSSQSNRMAFRLEGDKLERESSSELLSHAVLPGVVQVPASGQPIVLLADCQTTGGYPRIATVIEADLWKIAQTPIGQHFCFIEVDLNTAIAAQEKWQRELRRMDSMEYA